MIVLRRAAVLCATLVVSGVCTVATASGCDLERMEWLAGRWGGVSGGTRSVEIWSPPAGGVMLGLHHDRRGDGGTFHESLRIEQRGSTCVYVARPQGATPTEFRSTVHTSYEWVFENPDHDWPQRIAYRLTESGTLDVSASGPGKDGAERVLRWVWDPAD